MAVSYARNYATTMTINTTNYSQSFTPPFPLKTISIYSNQAVLVRFNEATDPDGNRTHQLRAGQSKQFDLTVRIVYLAKSAVGDPNATVDIDGMA